MAKNNGAKELAKKMESLQKELEAKADELTRDVLLTGMESATLYRSSERGGFQKYDGDDDVDISIQYNITGGKHSRKDTRHAKKGEGSLVAVGESVLFQEFGTGLPALSGHPDPQGFVAGSWSESHKHKWNSPSGWWYTGSDGERHHTYGNAPQMFMYKSYIDMKEKSDELMKEMFKK